MRQWLLSLQPVLRHSLAMGYVGQCIADSKDSDSSPAFRIKVGRLRGCAAVQIGLIAFALSAVRDAVGIVACPGLGRSDWLR